MSTYYVKICYKLRKENDSNCGKKEMIEDLRKKVAGEEFDYQVLIDVLRGYEHPRDKITALLRQGVIIRVKKGIYVFGEKYSRGPFSREVLANMIYGPSYVSLDYALHYYGLIPERVEAVTSVTSGRGRRFSTPVGLFIYRMIPLRAYQIGIDQVQIEGGRRFLIATPEKTLADKIHDDRGTGIRTQEGMKDYLLKNLRVDPGSLAKLDADDLALIASRYRSKKIRLLSDVARRFRRGEGLHE
jgi:predicted transcriptional regulator of viral defense system